MNDPKLTNLESIQNLAHKNVSVEHKGLVIILITLGALSLLSFIAFTLAPQISSRSTNIIAIVISLLISISCFLMAKFLKKQAQQKEKSYTELFKNHP